MDADEPILSLSTQTVFVGRVIKVVNELLRLTTGTLIHHVTVQHPGAVLCLPVQADGTLLAIRQYRHSVRQILLEFPAGTLEAGEDPLACAQRELAEEIGQQAGCWESLGELHPAPGFCNEVQYCFLATELSPCSLAPDEDEMIEVVPMGWAAVEQAIREGQMTDGKSIALYTRARLRGLVG